MIARTIIFALIAVLLGLAFGAWISFAFAQSWYPGECCAEYDCFSATVPREEIERRADGWHLRKEGRTIPFSMTRKSPDGKFHLCRNEMGKGKIIIPSGKLPCLWAPEVEG